MRSAEISTLLTNSRSARPLAPYQLCSPQKRPLKFRSQNNGHVATASVMNARQHHIAERRAAAWDPVAAESPSDAIDADAIYGQFAKTAPISIDALLRLVDSYVGGVGSHKDVVKVVFVYIGHVQHGHIAARRSSDSKWLKIAKNGKKPRMRTRIYLPRYTRRT